ncbi:DTW domain-containing protein [Vibrio sp. Of7-15]|uniref:tRNA-uridine aminocarboxypropyltransferase n=1 Tax=Vibrio sp. Of7-15 TaxID=2724879 RepID=UPI001EF36AFF|nr:DTW domain-containing protein [Vibrio sp. Of7-15]MCG7495828.1 DTW domain-containing protein [Vibrio sp. Of7-15]
MGRYCDRCEKALKACICAWIKPLKSSTELIILQHPTEVRRPIGTARILTLSLGNSRRFVGEDFSEHPELNTLLYEDGYLTCLVYPGEHSVGFSGIKQAASDKKIRVILLDGTWRKAYKMWQVSKNLHALPMVHLDPELFGDYKIRKAPKDNGLSTVEAGYHSLCALEPEQTEYFQPLLEAFNHMIEFQIKQMPAGVFEKNYSR